MIRAEKIDFVTKVFEMDKHSSNLPAVPNPNLPKVSSEKSFEADGEVSAMKYMKNIEAKLHKLDFYSSNFVENVSKWNAEVSCTIAMANKLKAGFKVSVKFRE